MALASAQWLAIIKTERNFVCGGGKNGRGTTGDWRKNDLCSTVQNN